VFCDGDFWHGKDWEERRGRLEKGWNAAYWIGKIEANNGRERRNDEELRKLGWMPIRVWESDIYHNPGHVASAIYDIVVERRGAPRR
jgi:DNA mismatch endonuclease (patch repair protein)